MGTELFHLMNRGVDKRTIALDDRDRHRFIADLYAMNDARAVGNVNYHFARSMDIGRPYDTDRERERLVTVHGWCLMKNHYHLLVSEEAESGLSRFLKKLNMGYAKYFNERYERSGALFQGKTKKVPIEREAHFNWILHYIHFNPLDYLRGAGDWRTQCLIRKKASEYLETYRWSSYRDYLGSEEYAAILDGSFMFKDRAVYAKEGRRTLDAMADAPLSLKALE